MSVSCFTSTNLHLCKFLRTTGRDWRNTIYIECGDCQRAVSRSCKKSIIINIYLINLKTFIDPYKMRGSKKAAGITCFS